MYVYKSNEKKENFRFFLDFFFDLNAISVYSKHALKHFDTLLNINLNQKNENFRFFLGNIFSHFFIFQKNLKFSFFSFDLYTYIVLKYLNKFKIYRYDFFHFSIFHVSRLFPFCFPVVFPRCSAPL